MNRHAILPLYREARAQGIGSQEARAIAEREYARAMSTLQRMKLHAPTPWHVATWADADAVGFADIPPIIADKRGYTIALASNDAPMSEANATAARIVECVNAFHGVTHPAEYLEELRSIARMMDELTR